MKRGDVMNGKELFQMGFLPSDCATSSQINEWRAAAEECFGQQYWIAEACCNGLDALESVPEPAPYAHLITGDQMEDAGVMALALISDDELEHYDRWMDALAVDEAQSEYTDWRG